MVLELFGSIRTNDHISLVIIIAFDATLEEHSWQKCCAILLPSLDSHIEAKELKRLEG